MVVHKFNYPDIRLITLYWDKILIFIFKRLRYHRCTSYVYIQSTDIILNDNEWWIQIYVKINIWKSMSAESHIPVYVPNTNYVLKI